METTELRDNANILKAIIKTLDSGFGEIRTPSGILKGYYDPIKNETRYANGILFGKGNLLTQLV